MIITPPHVHKVVTCCSCKKNKQLENIRKPNQQYTLHFNFSFCLYVCLFYAPRTQTFSQDSPTWIQTEKRQYPGILRALDRIRWAWAKEELGYGLPPPEHLRPWIPSNHLIDLIQQRFNLGAALKIRSFHLQLSATGEKTNECKVTSIPSAAPIMSFTADETTHDSYDWFLPVDGNFQTLFANFYKLGRPVFAFFMMLFGPKPPFATDLELAVSSGAGNANISVLPSLLALAFRQRWNSFTRWGYLRVLMLMVLVVFPNAWFLSWFVEVKQRHGESHYSEISWDFWAKRLNKLEKHGKATKNHPSISQHSYNLRLFVLPYRLVFSYCVQHQHCQEEEHQNMCNVYIILRYINNLYDNLIYKYHKYHQANSEYFYNQPEKKLKNTENILPPEGLPQSPVAGAFGTAFAFALVLGMEKSWYHVSHEDSWWNLQDSLQTLLWSTYSLEANHLYVYIYIYA